MSIDGPSVSYIFNRENADCLFDGKVISLLRWPRFDCFKQQSENIRSYELSKYLNYFDRFKFRYLLDYWSVTSICLCQF